MYENMHLCFAPACSIAQNTGGTQRDKINYDSSLNPPRHAHINAA